MPILTSHQPGGTPAGGRRAARPSAQARFTLALAAGKAAGTASRALRAGGGTSLVGQVALRIDPHVLRKVAAASDARTVIVTGSNGKTTTCRMLAAMAQAGRLAVTQNRSGSNLLQGVVSAAVRGTDLRGRMDAELFLLEVDEATVRRVTPDVPPAMLLITNIFRDQLDRFGELYSMAKGLEAVIEALPASATVVLNGDDPLVASLAPGAAARRLYFGIRAGTAGPQAARARRGHHPLRALPAPAPLSRRVPLPPGRLRVPGVRPWPPGAGRRGDLGPAVAGPGVRDHRADSRPERSSCRCPCPARTTCTTRPPRWPPGWRSPRHGRWNRPRRAGPWPACAPRSGAWRRSRPGQRRIVLAFVKNPTAYNATLREVLRRPGRKHVLAAHSNTVVDGEDFAWLWDVDLEQLVPQLASLVASGTRAEEVTLRFKYAGADPAVMHLRPSRPAALQAALAATPPGESLYIFAGYTPMRELRSIMQRRGWVAPSWKE